MRNFTSQIVTLNSSSPESEGEREREREREASRRRRMSAASAVTTAGYLARRAAQKERVRILYRRALKDTLNWAVHRHLFYQDVLPLSLLGFRISSIARSQHWAADRHARIVLLFYLFFFSVFSGVRFAREVRSQQARGTVRFDVLSLVLSREL